MRHWDLHPWDVTPKEAMRVQTELRERLLLENDFGSIRVIAGADVAVDNEANEGYGGVIAFSFPDLREIERRQATDRLTFPYVPGLLAFREAPVLLKAFEQLTTEPDLLMFDGQGIAHPRGLGIASHLGILLDKPSIGCAKSLLVGSFQEPGRDLGDHSPLIHQGKVVGAVLRTRKDVQPIFVSPGHKIDLETSTEIVLKCLDGYRVPKPTREADHFVETLKKRPAPQEGFPQLPLGSG